MKNKGLIITLGVLSAIAIAAYVVYTLMKGKTNGIKTPAGTHKGSNVTTSKQVATAAAKAKENPNDIAAQQAYTQLGLSLVNALLKTNKTATPSTSPKGTPSITVDRKGSYIEKSDASTLYNKDGSVKGDLDPMSGMFVDKNGNIVANSDGSPATQTADGFITESDGSKYTLDGTPIQQYDNGTYAEIGDDGKVKQMYADDGTPIQQNSNGTYSELDENGNIAAMYADDGTPIQQNSNGTYSELDSNGNITATYADDGTPIIETTASNTPAYDPTTDPDSPYYIDPNIGASGYRSNFGKKTIYSLLK
jgi:hypothetical protein